MNRPGSPLGEARAYSGWNVQARLGVYKAGLCFTVDRWTRGSYAQSVHASLARSWYPPEALTAQEALDRLIEAMVIYKNTGRPPVGGSF